MQLKRADVDNGSCIGVRRISLAQKTSAALIAARVHIGSVRMRRCGCSAGSAKNKYRIA